LERIAIAVICAAGTLVFTAMVLRVQPKISDKELRACSKSGILALQTPKFYLAGSKRARKSGFLWSIDRKKSTI
jgi:hypothetical protein